MTKPSKGIKLPNEPQTHTEPGKDNAKRTKFQGLDVGKPIYGLDHKTEAERVRASLTTWRQKEQSAIERQLAALRGGPFQSLKELSEKADPLLQEQQKAIEQAENLYGLASLKKAVAGTRPLLQFRRKAIEDVHRLPASLTSTSVTVREPYIPDFEGQRRAYERREVELARKRKIAELEAQKEWEQREAQAKGKNTEPAKESATARQDRRLQICVDAGYAMKERHLLRLPDGVGALAQQEGISRQAFTEDVKAALKRKIANERPKPTLVSRKR